MQILRLNRVASGLLFLGVLLSAHVAHTKLARERAREIIENIWDNNVDAVVSALEGLKGDPQAKEVINNPAGDHGRAILHEMARNDWAYLGDDKLDKKLKAINLALELGADMTQEETTGSGHLTPVGVAKEFGKTDTKYYLRAKELLAGLGPAATAKEWEDAIWNWDEAWQIEHFHAILKSIEMGKTPWQILNEPRDEERAALHMMGRKDFASKKTKPAKLDARRKAINKAIALGADLYQKDKKNGWTPRDQARESGNTDTEEYFKNKEPYRELLQVVLDDKEASRPEKAERAIALLNEGALPDGTRGDLCHRTPFHHAIRHGWYEKGGKHREAVELMVAKGADLNQRDYCKPADYPNGQRPLDTVNIVQKDKGVLAQTKTYLEGLMGIKSEPPAETTWWKEFQMGMGGRGSSATPKIGGQEFFNVVYTLSRKKFPDSVSDHDRIKDTKKKSESELWELFDACIDDAKCDVNYAADWNYGNIPMNLIAQLNWPAQGGKWEEATKKILKRGADIDRKNSTGYSPMTEVGTTEATREFIRKNR